MQTVFVLSACSFRLDAFFSGFGFLFKEDPTSLRNFDRTLLSAQNETTNTPDNDDDNSETHPRVFVLERVG